MRGFLEVGPCAGRECEDIPRGRENVDRVSNDGAGGEGGD